MVTHYLFSTLAVLKVHILNRSGAVSVVGSFEDYVGAFHVDGCAVVTYAEDVLFIIWVTTRALLEERSHLALNIIQNRATNYKMEISQEK